MPLVRFETGLNADSRGIPISLPQQQLRFLPPKIISMQGHSPPPPSRPAFPLARSGAGTAPITCFVRVTQTYMCPATLYAGWVCARLVRLSVYASVRVCVCDGARVSACRSVSLSARGTHNE